MDKSGTGERQPIELVWDRIKTAEEVYLEDDEEAISITSESRDNVIGHRLQRLANTAESVEVFFPWGNARGNLRLNPDGTYSLTIMKAELRPFGSEHVVWVEGRDITLGV